MSRGKFLITAAIVVLLGGAVAAVIVGSGDDSPPPATIADLPAPARDEARATLSYLKGDGAALMRMHESVTQEPLTGGRQGCKQAVQRLDSAAPSGRVAGLIGGVRDDPLRAAFDEERLALGVGLTRCVKEGAAMSDDEAHL